MCSPSYSPAYKGTQAESLANGHAHLKNKASGPAQLQSQASDPIWLGRLVDSSSQLESLAIKL